MKVHRLDIESVFRYVIPFLLTAVYSNCAFAQLGMNAHATSGLLDTATPHSLGRGTLAVSVMTRYIRYNDNDPRGEAGQLIAVASYGILDQIDVSIRLPYELVHTGLTGYGSILGSIKYEALKLKKLTFSVNSSVLFAHSGRSYLVRSGKAGWFVQLNLGFIGESFHLYSSIGVGDVELLDPLEKDLTNAKTYQLAVGLAHQVFSTVNIALEGVAFSVPEYRDEETYIQLGAISQLTKHLYLKGSLGSGLPNLSRDRTKWILLTGISIETGNKNKF